jgi:hypothetical protein
LTISEIGGARGRRLPVRRRRLFLAGQTTPLEVDAVGGISAPDRLAGRDVVQPRLPDVMPATASTWADVISIPSGRDASNGINLGGRDLAPCARDLLPPTAGAIIDR